VYPKVSGLASWSENCKWYSYLLLGEVQLYRYFVSQSSEFCRRNPLCCFSTSVYRCYFVIDSVRKFWIHPRIVIHDDTCSRRPFRKLLDTPSYILLLKHINISILCNIKDVKYFLYYRRSLLTMLSYYTLGFG
jgi:hypothetical protein